MNTTESSKKNELINNVKNLLTEHTGGIQPNELETVYNKKFSKSLLFELLQLIFLDGLESSVSIIPGDQKSGTSDMIRLTSEEANDQFEDPLLQEINASGIVSQEFHYVPNPVIDENNGTFPAFVSHVDQHTLLIYIQPECNIKHMEKLTELLDTYYSDAMSQILLVKDPMTGLICVSKFDGVYHRMIIKEDRPDKYVVQYVDIGLTKELGKNDVQLKHLVNYFAEVPCIAIACSLVGIEFKSYNYHTPPESYQTLNQLSQMNGPIFVEPYRLLNDVLQIKIYDADRNCLNDYLVQHGLAFQAPMPPSIDVQNNENREEIQNQPSTKTLNGSHENGTMEKTVHVKSEDLFGDYMSADAEVNSPPIQQRAAKQSALPASYIDYENDTDTAPTNSRQTRASSSMTGSQMRRGVQSNRRVNQQNGHQVERPSQLQVTINRGMPGVRLFGAAVSGLSSNKRIYERKPSDRMNDVGQQKKDDYAEWMCSFSPQESIWYSDGHKSALLKYIGRVYKQPTNMYRIFANLKNDFGQLDELDVLHRLISSAKERQDALKSFNQWKDTSRIKRRLEELRVIFEFDGDYSASRHPFIISPSGLQTMMDCRRIRSYFDLGCGDGTITAGIGASLGLSREQIFGGDIFEVQNDQITFIRVNENQSGIALPDQSVDLVTSFVTFHHVSQVKKTLTELARIIRPGGYLILREHDCKDEHSLPAKYLNFVHAIMMIAGVGEFADCPTHNSDYENSPTCWLEQKKRIIEYTKTIRYKSCTEWQQELENVGFRHCATLRYGANGSDNPQNLFYAVYQINGN